MSGSWRGRCVPVSSDAPVARDSRRLDWHETGRVLRELRSTAQRHYCISMFMCLNFTRYCSFFAFSSGDSPSSSSMVK